LEVLEFIHYPIGLQSYPSPLEQYMRNQKELLVASKAFTSETKWLSWWHLLFATGLYLLSLLIACSSLPLVIRIASSCISGLIVVRLFIIYHDYCHGTILRKSWLAAAILKFYGLLVLSPPSVWSHTHDHHHKHNSRSSGNNSGSYPLMTRDEYVKAGGWKRFAYAVSRHPITVFSGYLTVFLYGMSIRSFFLHPLRHLDAGLAVVLHVSLLTICWYQGWDVLILAMILPLVIACGLGAYLFYAQHNFPSCQLHKRENWHYVLAALKSSSYIRMSKLMHWFTGNVGYHHVHHLNAKIPFYRLPEAMNALEELQSPGTTSLHPRDVFACFRLKVWDVDRGHFISFREAARG
jgi:omega-6 fatty acid desaturase (delta-12 desaturase)